MSLKGNKTFNAFYHSIAGIAASDGGLLSERVVHFLWVAQYSLMLFIKISLKWALGTMDYCNEKQQIKTYESKENDHNFCGTIIHRDNATLSTVLKLRS